MVTEKEMPVEEKALHELLGEATRLEQNVGDVYHLFFSVFPQDEELWWRLTLEEKNHASLLESVELYLNIGLFPTELIYNKLDTLKKINAELNEMIQNYKTNPPTREEAFRIAIMLEESAAETHFQEAISAQSDNPLIQILQRLNGDDKDHAARIRNYCIENKINLE